VNSRRAIAAALLFVASCASFLSFAQRPSVFLEELTSPELRAAIVAGKTTVLVPIGGTEQNGPHMVLGKHNARAWLLSGKIASTLGNAIVAPVVAYVPEGTIDPPSQHMRFPGTITVSEETFEKLLESAARSFRVHGFRDIVLLGDHGGYQRSLRRVAERLNNEWSRTGIRVHALPEYYATVEKEFPAYLERKGHTPAEIGLHAGLADTSLSLAVDPSLVRTDHLKDEAGPKNGVVGDPARASAELGKAGVDLVVSRTVEAIRKAVRR
jgi:creatinine amidohydrolase/Fe(II)-dependent formamide hydrolase-like protein